MRRTRKALVGLLSNTAYIAGLWLLSILTMLACLALLALAIPAMASADQTDVKLAQLEQTAQQWWASYGLTTDMPYAAGGNDIALGCGDTVRILREHIDALGDVAYPHGCDIHLNEDLVRAAFGGQRPAALRFQIASAGLRPRGRYAARELLCAVMFHETGHVLGLPHASTGIMRDGAPAPPPTCVTWARG